MPELQVWLTYYILTMCFHHGIGSVGQSPPPTHIYDGELSLIEIDFGHSLVCSSADECAEMYRFGI